MSGDFIEESKQLALLGELFFAGGIGTDGKVHFLPKDQQDFRLKTKVSPQSWKDLVTESKHASTDSGSLWLLLGMRLSGKNIKFDVF